MRSSILAINYNVYTKTKLQIQFCCAIVLLSSSLSFSKDIISLSAIQNPVQEPKNCISQKFDSCAFKTQAGEKYEYKADNLKIVLSESTSLLRVDEKHWILLGGVVWVRSQDGLSMKTEYGEMILDSKQEVWIENLNKKTQVDVIAGELKLIPRNSKQEIGLVEGEQNWLGPIDKSKVATSGIPRPIDFKMHMLRWAKLYRGSKNEFQEDAKEFYERWKLAIADISLYHDELANRYVSSIEEKKAEEARRRAEKAKKDKFYKTWFKQRYLSE